MIICKSNRLLASTSDLNEKADNDTLYIGFEAILGKEISAILKDLNSVDRKIENSCYDENVAINDEHEHTFI